MVFESNYIIVLRFAVRYFCGGFLYEKMAACLYGETECLFSFCLVYVMC